MKKVIALMTLAAMPVLSQAAVDVVQNGSFENNSGFATNAIKVQPGLSGQTLANWVATAGSSSPSYVDVINTNNPNEPGAAAVGNYFIELDTDSGNTPSSNTSILQSFTGLSGSYLFSFQYSGITRPASQTVSQMQGFQTDWFDVLWNGTSINSIFKPTDYTVTDANNWVTFTTTLVSTGNDTLVFQGLGVADSVGARIDDVQLIGNAAVAAVPESDTYAMMLAGLGMLGFVSRRRRA